MQISDRLQQTSNIQFRLPNILLKNTFPYQSKQTPIVHLSHTTFGTPPQLLSQAEAKRRKKTESRKKSKGKKRQAKGKEKKR